VCEGVCVRACVCVCVSMLLNLLEKFILVMQSHENDDFAGCLDDLVKSRGNSGHKFRVCLFFVSC